MEGRAGLAAGGGYSPAMGKCLDVLLSSGLEEWFRFCFLEGGSDDALLYGRLVLLLRTVRLAVRLAPVARLSFIALPVNGLAAAARDVPCGIV